PLRARTQTHLDPVGYHWIPLLGLSKHENQGGIHGSTGSHARSRVIARASRMKGRNWGRRAGAVLGKGDRNVVRSAQLPTKRKARPLPVRAAIGRVCLA